MCSEAKKAGDVEARLKDQTNAKLPFLVALIAGNKASECLRMRSAKALFLNENCFFK
jgi:hypothetical protein